MRKAIVYRAIARGVVLESIRRKDIWVVAILGFLVILSAGTLGFFGFQGLEVFAKDLGLSTLGLFATAVAALVSTRLLPDEVKNRTLYPMLARPITRFDFLLGKWLGAAVVSWIAFAALGAMVLAALLIFGVRLEPILLQYALCKMLGLAMVCAVGVSLSSCMTASAAATMTLLLALTSAMLSRAFLMAGAESESLAPALQLLHFILPQFHLFDLSGRAVNTGWPAAPFWVVGALAGYMALYSLSALVLGWARFRRQAI